jgi:hypothetical protein
MNGMLYEEIGNHSLMLLAVLTEHHTRYIDPKWSPKGNSTVAIAIITL